MAIAEKLGQIRDDVNTIKTVLGVPQDTSLADTVSAIEGVNDALESMTEATAAGDFISVNEYFNTTPSVVPNGSSEHPWIENYFLKTPPTITIPSDKAYQSISYIAWQYSFKKIPKIIFSNNVTQAESAFSNARIEEIDVSGFNLSGTYSIRNMFNNCRNLTQLDASSWNSSTTTSIASLFNGCTALTEVKLGTFTAITEMGYIFYNCTNLVTIDMSHIDGSHIVGNANSSSTYLFRGCSALENLSFMTGFGDGIGGFDYSVYAEIDLSESPLLTHDSLMDVINKLGNIAVRNKSEYLRLGQTNIDKLTAEEIAIATNKGWTVA